MPVELLKLELLKIVESTLVLKISFYVHVAIYQARLEKAQLLITVLIYITINSTSTLHTIVLIQFDVTTNNSKTEVK